MNVHHLLSDAMDFPLVNLNFVHLKMYLETLIKRTRTINCIDTLISVNYLIEIDAKGIRLSYHFLDRLQVFFVEYFSLLLHIIYKAVLFDPETVQDNLKCSNLKCFQNYDSSSKCKFSKLKSLS